MKKKPKPNNAFLLPAIKTIHSPQSIPLTPIIQYLFYKARLLRKLLTQQLMNVDFYSRKNL